jgi:hypothetical protein
MDIPNILPGVSGWPATLLTLFAIIVYGWYIRRSSKSKAEEVATTSYEKAIKAMETYSDVLGKRLGEAEKENTKLNHVVETIYAALRARGIYITIDGEMITIRDSGGSTTTQINGKQE